MSTFKHKDVNFHYELSHQGPAIIFLHGFLENHEMWKNVVNALPRAYRKICLDLPGHGKSDNIGYIHTMEEMADLVKALIDHKKLRKVILVGHSMGGYVALAFAERYPEHIKGVVLMNSTASADSTSKQKDRDRAIKLVKENHKAFIRTAIPLLFRPKNRRNFKEEIGHVKKQALQTSKQGIIAALEGMKVRADREVLLHFAPYPFLFIAAKNDPVFPFEALQEQLQAKKVTPCITENGHMSHIEDFDMMLNSIKQFLVSTKK